MNKPEETRIKRWGEYFLHHFVPKEIKCPEQTEVNKPVWATGEDTEIGRVIKPKTKGVNEPDPNRQRVFRIFGWNMTNATDRGRTDAKR